MVDSGGVEFSAAMFVWHAHGNVHRASELWGPFGVFVLSD